MLSVKGLRSGSNPRQFPPMAATVKPELAKPRQSAISGSSASISFTRAPLMMLGDNLRPKRFKLRAALESASTAEDKLHEKELRAIVEELGARMDDRTWSDIVSALGQDADGRVSWHKFLRLIGSASNKVKGGKTVKPKRSRAGGLAKIWSPEEVKQALAERSATQYRSVRRSFRDADKDKSGTLNKAEFRKVLANFNIALNAKNMDLVWRELDPDGSGAISYGEYTAAFGESISGGKDRGITSRLSGLLQHENAVHKFTGRGSALARWTPSKVTAALQERFSLNSVSASRVFRRADTDKSGAIDLTEMRAVLANLNIEMSDDDFDAFVACELDTSGDGLVDYPEFLAKFGAAIAGASDTFDIRNHATGFVTDGHTRRVVNVPKNPRWEPHAALLELQRRLATNFTSVRAAFRQMDDDKSGKLSPDEFRGVLLRLNMEFDTDDFDKLMEMIDTNHDGSISYGEFMTDFGAAICGGSGEIMNYALQRPTSSMTSLQTSGKLDLAKAKPPQHPSWTPSRVAAALESHMAVQSKSVHMAFLKADADRSGYLSYDEFRETLRRFNIEMCDADYAAFLAEIDGSGDGKISYSEFAKRFGVGIAGAADQGLLKNRASLAFSRSARKVAPPSTHALTAENAYAALCSKLSVQHKSVRRAWLSADTDASGSLTTDELRALMARYNVVLSDVEYKRLLGMIDLSGDGAIEYDEFLAHFGKGIAGQSGSLSITSSFRAGPGVRQPPNPKWTVAEVEAVLAEKFRINSHSVRKVFLNADEDHSGQLSPDELKQVLRKYNIEMDDGPFRQLVASLDPDGSGDLDYNEFIARWGDTIAGGHSDDSFLREMLNRPAGGREQNDDDESWWSFDDRDNDDPAAEQALVEKAVESVLARPQADNKALGSQASADRYGKAAPAAARSARPRTVGNLTSALRRDRRLQTSESAAALTVGKRRVMKEKLADDVSQARLAQAVTAHYGKLVRALRNLDSRRTGLVLIRDLEATFAKAGVLLDKKSASRLFARHGKASRVKYLDLLRDVTGAAPPLSASASATALGGGGGTGRIRAAQWGPPSRDWAEVTATDHDAAMRASTSSRAFR